MKKLILAGTAALALALTGCAGQSFSTPDYDDYNGYSSSGGYSANDWDLNNPSIYNNNTYCSGGTYTPLAGNQYSCNRSGVISTPSARPSAIVPPKSAQKAPADVLKKVEEQKIKRQQVTQQKAQQKKAEQQKQNAPKAPAPKAPSAPKAPAAKTVK